MYCGKGNKCTIPILEAGLGLTIAVICIQKPFLRNQSISHSRFNPYWPFGTGIRKDMLVLRAVQKDILNKVIIENRTNLVNHLYCIILDIKEFHPVSGKHIRKTRVVNLYDNKLMKNVYGKDQSE